MYPADAAGRVPHRILDSLSVYGCPTRPHSHENSSQFGSTGGVEIRTRRALGPGEELCFGYRDASAAVHYANYGIPNPEFAVFT